MALNSILLSLVVVFAFTVNIEGAKVLVFNPYFAHSHFTFQNALAEELIEDGHNVTILIPEIDPSTVKTPEKATVVIRKVTVAPFRFDHNDEATAIYWKNEGFEFWNNKPMMQAWNDAATEACRRLLSDTAFIDRLKSEKFDSAILEPLDLCGFGLLKLIGVKNYALTVPLALSDYAANMLGLPGQTFAKFAVNTAFNPDMTLFERIQDIWVPILNDFLHDMDISLKAVKEIVDPNFNVNSIYPNARYIFINAEEHVDFPRPLSPKVVYIGGITVNKNSLKPLPTELATTFESANNVVLISFGSLAKSSAMPQNMKSAFVEMFAAFPEVTFIWKYENASNYPAGHLSNVIPTPWVPQKEILSHPKTIAFVTHGGMNSITECAHAGVAAIAVPLFGDQPRNAKMLEYRKTAVVVEKQDIIGDVLIKAMKTVISDEYQKRSDDLAAVIAAKPMQPRERFVKFFNHAVAFGHVDDFLDNKMRLMSSWKYYNVDIYFGFAVIVLTLAVLIKNLLMKSLSFLTVKRKSKIV